MEHGERVVENPWTIQVRSLTGESSRVLIEPNKTVLDLKLLLKQSFSPVSSCNDFHLFIKGIKLKLEDRISDFFIDDSEFLVVVPFAKKDKKRKVSMDAGTNHGVNSNLNPSENLETGLAESAWVELMCDLSSWHDASKDEIVPPVESRIANFENDTIHSRMIRRNKKMSLNFKEKENSVAALNILQNSHRNSTHELNVKGFLEFVDSSSCLIYPDSGTCVMREASDIIGHELDPGRSNGSMCRCPSWLKDIMQAFYFLNVYSACLQLWKKTVTLNALESALLIFHKCGFRPTVRDLEHLSEVCPQVIRFVDSEGGSAKLSDPLIVLKLPTEKQCQSEDELIPADKRLPKSKIIKWMKKREALLIDVLSRAVKSVMLSTAEVTTCSREGLMTFVKNETAKVEQTAAKQERKKYSSSCLGSLEIRCHDTNSLLPEEMVRHLRFTVGSQEQLVHVEEISARGAKYADIPCELSECVKSALIRVGITKLYSHQAKSIRASLAGKNVIVATMTSSGKSLCYNVPVLEALSSSPLACALYLFPTKALAQDQLRAMQAMFHGLDDNLTIGIYDGDTSREDRQWLRDNARLLITNPDMLHVSILPYHGQFKRILSNLRFIVIDEAHVYKGTFGCHAALIFRRLRRICSHLYGIDPSFVFTTATSANPREHAMELANLSEIELIENDGSPSGLKFFMLWNPPSCLKKLWKRTNLDSKKSVDEYLVAGRSRYSDQCLRSAH